MVDERDVLLDESEEDIERMAESPFIDIPAGPEGPKEGDDAYFLVEVQANINEKTSGSSYQIPLVIVEEGINKGKSVDWYAGYRGQALGIFARALKAFGKKDEVLYKDKKGGMHLAIDRLAGAQAQARFVRQWSNPQEPGKEPVLRAVLDSLSFKAPEDLPF